MIIGSKTVASHKASPSTLNFKWGRNSSIELLRIVAMFMILAHHFIVHNGYDVKNLSLGPERIFFQLVMQWVVAKWASSSSSPSTHASGT